MSEHIVATFSTQNEATAAARDLEAAGIPASSIRRYTPQGTTTDASVRGTAEPTSASGGFWAWLLGEEPAGETTRSAYSRDDEWYDRRGHCILRAQSFFSISTSAFSSRRWCALHSACSTPVIL